MDDLISRQAAIESSLAFLVEYLGGAFDEGLQEKLKTKIETIPAEDVAPVVRCRNCKHLANRDEEGGKCWRGSGFARVVKNDDFCSYGERKE